MSKVTHIAVATGDNSKWTPLDCLKDFIADVESGIVNPKRLSICYVEEDDEGKMVFGYQNAKLSYLEHMAMMEVLKQLAYRRFEERRE